MTNTGRVLVTGASGFVGSAVVGALLAAGYPVRALVRVSSPRGNLAALDVATVEGDMRDAASVARAMAGARYAMHVAADYRLWSSDREEIRRNNVLGTRNVMEAALRCGVERIVYTSSVAALALRADRQAADESTALVETAAIGAYKRSKVAAQHLVEAMIANAGLPAVIVNPSTPIGPRDIKPTPTGRIIVEAASGRMPGYLDTGLNLVHVDDVAAGHVAALTRTAKSASATSSAARTSLLADMLRDIAQRVGRRPPWLRMSRRLLYPAAALAEIVAARTGREPFLTLDGLRMAKNRMFFSSAKATRDLGYVARPLWRRAKRRDPLVSKFRASQMTALSIAWMGLGAWIYLLLLRGGFWRAAERDDGADAAASFTPDAWPRVVAIVPARNAGLCSSPKAPGRFCARIIRGRSTSSWSTTTARTTPPTSPIARQRKRPRPTACWCCARRICPLAGRVSCGP